MSEDNKVSKNWVAIREECVSGGALNDTCNLVAASQGAGLVEIVLQKLSCGCFLVPEEVVESDEDIII